VNGLATAETQHLTRALLANTKKLGTTDSRFFLVSRSRLLTPLGAAEYLKVKATHEAEAWDARVKVCLDVMELYRTFYPRQYAASTSPHYSTAREHEFYRLVNEHLFPLTGWGADRQDSLEELIRRDPNFFLPAIPLAGTQQHDWQRGCCPFPKLQTVFKLALCLIGHPLGKVDAFVREFGLAHEPAPPLAAWGWQQFLLMCGVHDGPLRYLPLAIDMVCYSTRTPWLDIPPKVAGVTAEWGVQTIGKLFLARQKAEQVSMAVFALDAWLNESPAERVGHAVKLWNSIHVMEEQSGFGGMTAEQIMEAMR
jgi:hypothetical protein